MILKLIFKTVIYLICSAMIIGGTYMISTFPSNKSSFLKGKQFIAGLGIVIVALVYLISDILIFLKERKNSKNNF